jgi:hypothetical protein
MRGGRAGWHQPGCRVRYVRATPLASFSSSPCQTAQSSSFPWRVAVRGFLASASRSPPQLRGGRAPEAGHWHVHRACEARRLASRATGGRLSALKMAIFGRRTDASSSGSAHRNPRRDFAHSQAQRPADRVRASHSRGSLRRLGTPLPRSALGASPVTPLVSEDGITTTTSSTRSQLHFALDNVVIDLNEIRALCRRVSSCWQIAGKPPRAGLISHRRGRNASTGVRGSRSCLFI